MTTTGKAHIIMIIKYLTNDITSYLSINCSADTAWSRKPPEKKTKNCIKGVENVKILTPTATLWAYTAELIPVENLLMQK